MSQGDWGQNHAQEKRTTSSPGVQQTILEHAVEITGLLMGLVEV